MKSTVKFITRTAVILALAVLFQSLRLLIPMPPTVNQYLTGSLVNLCLIVAAVMVGIKGGLVIAIVTPIIAFIQGFTPPFPIMIILIALGNIALVLVAGLLYKKSSILALMLGAALKFITLYIGVVQIGVPLLLTNAPDKLKAVLSVQFSWPQLVTAVIGGVIAIGVLRLLKTHKSMM